jgi:phospholipid/cholesterol/gamma-HCH transport system substrate-binding protein
MDHRISKTGVALCIVLTLIAVVTFVYLNQTFEGPNPAASIQPDRYEVTATFKDTEALPTKQPVLAKGVQVGKVISVEYDKEESTGVVTFTVDGDYAPIHNDAMVTIGERSVLGDPYLNLDMGNDEAGELESGAEIESAASVDFDEAFDFLDDDGRRHLNNLVDTLGEGTGDPENGFRLSGTFGGFQRSLVQLNTLTDTLAGQEEALAGLVADTSIVVTELGAREEALRTIVSAGRVTLETAEANSESLGEALTELPLLLGSGQRALAAARPLLEEAHPLVSDLRALTPDLEPVVDALEPLSLDASAVIEGLQPLREASEPAFATLMEILEKTPPLIEGLVPGMRNLVPALRYIEPRAESIGAFFANTTSATQSGDSISNWARFHLIFEPGTFNDVPLPITCYPEDDIPTNFVGVCNNAFPGPRDALDPEPYVPGSFERLKPFDVPPPPKPGTSE